MKIVITKRGHVGYTYGLVDTKREYLAGLLSAMFNRAVREKLIEENPFRGCRVPKWAFNEARDREPFTREEIQRILAELPDEWPDMVAVCLLLGGLRLSDVATLRWKAIDFERGLVQVTDQKTNKPRRKPLIKPLHRSGGSHEPGNGTFCLREQIDHGMHAHSHVSP